MDASGNQSIKRRSGRGCEAPPENKRRKKESGLWSLPDEVLVSCVAQVSRVDQAALSLVSKRYRSLIASPEMVRTRRLIGCTDATFYVCLRIYPETSPRWFILTCKRRRLSPIPSNPYQAQGSSSFVVVDSGIYVIGGVRNGKRTSDVWFLECFSHSWRQAPSMKMARSSASAHLVDGKIYVFGGLSLRDDKDYSTTWAEVFDPNTQTWVPLILEPKKKIGIIFQSVVIEGKKIYAVDREKQSFTISVLPTVSTSVGKLDNKPDYRNEWCVIGKMLFSCANLGTIVWCEPDELDWKEVRGLDVLKNCHLFGSRRHKLPSTPAMVGFRYQIRKLCTNSAGNIVIFWVARKQYPECSELWSAEISVERRSDGGSDEVWGYIERIGLVFCFCLCLKL
uniref:F-box/kelch-repeat protein SKIP6 n=2 Tax=Noccaea caerulescens TaxID=107243 RepID=A0A1J3ETV4_NOCCA